MALIIAEFFGLIGLDYVPPSNIAELIPYLLCAYIGVVLVCGCFRVVGKLADLLIGWRRW